MSEEFTRPNMEAKIHDLAQFTFFDDIPSRPGFRARLVFGERNGAPRISFMPNLEEGPKVVAIGMGPIEFDLFLDEFEQVIRGENGKRRFIDNFAVRPEVPREKPPTKDDLMLKNRLFMGKDENGICWLGVSANERNTRVRILPSMWHQFYKEDGTPVTEAEASQKQSLHLIRVLRQVFARWTSRLKPPFEGGVKKAPVGGTATAPAASFSTFSSEDIAF